MTYLCLTVVNSKGEVKFTHMLTVNILVMVTFHSVKTCIAIKQHIVYGITSDIFTFDHDPFKGQGQGYANFVKEYLSNGN